MPPGAWLALAGLAVVVGLGLPAADLPARVLARRVVRALPFFLLPALTLPFSVPGPVLAEIGPFTLSGPGSLRAAEIILRATLAVSAVTIVISTTRVTDLLRALDSLPLPRLVTGSLALGYRYVYLLNDELDRTGRALHSRAGRARRLRLWRARAAALAHMFFRAHDRSTRIHAAMLSRGYRGRLPVLHPVADVPGTWSLMIVALIALVWLAGIMEVTG
jgi:cobalt/nickel transport system permease protein